MKGMPKEARMVIATSIHQSTQASTTMLWPKRGTAMSTMQFTMVASPIGIVPANMALQEALTLWHRLPCHYHGFYLHLCRCKECHAAQGFKPRLHLQRVGMMLAKWVWCALRRIAQHSPSIPGVHDVARYSNDHKQHEEERIEHEKSACNVLHSLELHPGLTAGMLVSKWRHPCRGVAETSRCAKLTTGMEQRAHGAV